MPAVSFDGEVCLLHNMKSRSTGHIACIKKILIQDKESATPVSNILQYIIINKIYDCVYSNIDDSFTNKYPPLHTTETACNKVRPIANNKHP